MLLHLPMSPDCDICQLAKISLTPARRLHSAERATDFGARLYLDLIGPIHPDFSGNIHLEVARDEGTDFAFVVPITKQIWDNGYSNI